MQNKNDNTAAVRSLPVAGRNGGKQQIGAVSYCSTYGSKGQRSAAVATVVLSSTSGRPIFYKQKKRFISRRMKKDSNVRNGPPTHHGRRSATTDDAVHPPPTHRLNLHLIQQYSSAAVRTAAQQYVRQCSSMYSSAPASKKNKNGAVSSSELSM